MASDTEHARELLEEHFLADALNDLGLINDDTVDGALQAAFADGWKRAWKVAVGREYRPGVDPEPDRRVT